MKSGLDEIWILIERDFTLALALDLDLDLSLDLCLTCARLAMRC